MRGPVRLGDNRALVRLRSGEYICIDTNSIDAIDYLLGWPMEADYLPVFRTLLTPGSVVLDIGANFGLYTAVAGKAAGERGRVYAFEGNPHTFPMLLRTLYANRLIYNPNIVASNMLVSNESGRGTLYYYKEALGGATMSADVRWPGERLSVEVPMTTIDDFLPADLAVDLVKIDVEGHEPLVLLGMEKTIRRSPNIRLLIEYNESLPIQAMPVTALLDLIRNLGLHACTMLGRGQIEPIEPGSAPPRGGYWLLTRTPEADRERLWRRFNRPSVQFHRRAKRVWRALLRRPEDDY